MKVYLIIFSQLVFLINAKILYNCDTLCFGLDACVQNCKQQSLNTIKDNSIKSFSSFGGNKPKKGPQEKAEEGGDSILKAGEPYVEINANECGLRKASAGKSAKKSELGMGRIVGGEDALPNEFPWQVSFQIFIPKKNKIQHFCGGSIINKHWILSAAHCLDILVGKEANIIVKMGANVVLDEKLSKFTVNKMIVHENWSREIQADDIALVRLNEEIEFKTNNNNEYEINSVCLPEKDYEASGVSTLSGWGQTGTEEAQAEYLQKINIPIYDQQQCVVNYKKYVQITNTKLCAGGKGGQDSCMGDSGGPLIQLLNGRAVQIGVVSFGYPCAVKDMPGVYTKISKYRDWIEKHMS